MELKAEGVVGPPTAPFHAPTNGVARTFGVHPVGVEIRQSRLIADVLYRFRWLLVNDAAGAPSPAPLLAAHPAFPGGVSWISGLGIGGEGKSARHEEGRQLGGIDV